MPTGVLALPAFCLGPDWVMVSDQILLTTYAKNIIKWTKCLKFSMLKELIRAEEYFCCKEAVKGRNRRYVEIQG